MPPVLGVEELLEILTQKSDPLHIFTTSGMQGPSNIVQLISSPIESNEMCLNCESRCHSSVKCDLPDYQYCCEQCLVTSFDGGSHFSTCNEVNRVSVCRPNIYAKKETVLLEIKFLKREATIVYLNNGIFESLNSGDGLLSQLTDGLITMDWFETSNTLKYTAASFARFLVSLY